MWVAATRAERAPQHQASLPPDRRRRPRSRAFPPRVAGPRTAGAVPPRCLSLPAQRGAEQRSQPPPAPRGAASGAGQCACAAAAERSQHRGRMAEPGAARPCPPQPRAPGERPPRTCPCLRARARGAAGPPVPGPRATKAPKSAAGGRLHQRRVAKSRGRGRARVCAYVCVCVLACAPGSACAPGRVHVSVSGSLCECMRVWLCADVGVHLATWTRVLVCLALCM